MHIDKITTTVGYKPGRWSSINLAPHTVVVGENSAGKSRLTASLSLLLTGKAPGEVFGKADPVALTSDLAELSGSGHPLSVTGIINGVEITIPRSGGVEWSHPIRMVTQALRRGPAAATEFFAPFVIGDTVVDARGIPGGSAKATMDWLAQAVEGGRRAVKASGEQIKSLEGANVALSEFAAPPPSEEELQDAKNMLAGMDATLRDSDDGLLAVRALSMWQAEVRRAQTAVDAHPGALAQWEEAQRMAAAVQAWLASPQVAEATAAVAPLAAYKTALRAILPYAAPGQCPCCRNPANVEAMQTWAAGTSQEEEIVKYAAESRVKLSAALSVLPPSDLGALQQRLEWLQAQEPVVPVASGDREHVQTERDALARHIGQAEQAKATAAARGQNSLKLSAAQGKHHENQGHLEQLTALLDVTLARCAADFETAVAAHLPPWMHFVLKMERDSGAPIFRFYMRDDDGTVHLPTGGAERTMLLYALAAACYARLPQKPGYAVFILDEERAIDAKRLCDMMLALSSCPHQIVITSIVPPAGRAVDGWLVIDLNDVQPGLPLSMPKGKSRGKGKGAAAEPQEQP